MLPLPISAGNLVLILGAALALGIAVPKTTAQSPPPSGEDQENQPRENESETQEPTRVILDGPISIEGPITVVNQPTPEQQADRAEEEAQGVWDKAFAPERWPDIGLLLLAAIGTGFAIRAYYAGLRQAKAAENQVSIMNQQFEAMQRAHVVFDSLDVRDFEAGKEPVFFAKFRNDGLSTAINVRSRIVIAFKSVQLSSTDVTMSIPARSTKRHFVAFGQTLSEKMKGQINEAGDPLCVVIMLWHEENYEKHCREYNPWKEPRPQYVPLFINCGNKCGTEGPLALLAGKSKDESGGISAHDHSS